MDDRLALLFLVLVVPLLQECLVEGDAEISVRFTKYVNAKGVGSNGHCCDGKWGICQSNGCDHKFTVCMGNYSSPNNTKDCPLGKFQSDRIKNQNNNTFSRNIADLRNPLLFNVTGRLPDGITLKVDVYDSDKGTSISDHVDFLIYRAATKLNQKYTVNIRGTTPAKTILYAEMTIKCVNNTVGNRCESKAPRCTPPKPGDHYKCERHSGKKICTDGYMGTNCDHPPRGRPTGPARPSGSGGSTGGRPAPAPARPSPGGRPTGPSGGGSYGGRPTGPSGGRPTSSGGRPTGSSGSYRHTVDPPAAPNPHNAALRTHRPSSLRNIARRGDCDRIAELEANYRTVSGVYDIQPSGISRTFPVYCIMTNDARGWTQIQRRQESGRANFARNWQDYKAGFGEVGKDAEEWIGLDNLHAITSQRNYKLRIDFMGEDRRWKYALYDRFAVDGERDNYRLHVSGYDHQSTAGDAMAGSRGSSLHDGMAFSTPDRDNDRDSRTNCAEKFGGGWWFNACFFSNLNGPHRASGNCARNGGKCIAWLPHDSNAIVAVRMSILPN